MSEPAKMPSYYEQDNHITAHLTPVRTSFVKLRSQFDGKCVTMPYLCKWER